MMSVFAWFGVACAVFLSAAAAARTIEAALNAYRCRNDRYLTGRIIAHAWGIDRWCAEDERVAQTGENIARFGLYILNPDDPEARIEDHEAFRDRMRKLADAAIAARKEPHA